MSYASSFAPTEKKNRMIKEFWYLGNFRHCEKRADAAIQSFVITDLDCFRFSAFVMTAFAGGYGFILLAVGF